MILGLIARFKGERIARRSTNDMGLACNSIANPGSEFVVTNIKQVPSQMIMCLAKALAERCIKKLYCMSNIPHFRERGFGKSQSCSKYTFLQFCNF